MLKFSKNKMLERIKKEGRTDLISETEIAIMENLDGQTANPNCWLRIAMDKPVLWVVGKNGKGEYVNEDDCE